MNTVTATAFRRNLFSLLNTTITYNEPIQVTAKAGNAVIISADEWRDINETLAIMANTPLYRDVREGLATPSEECVPEEKVIW